MASPTLLDPNFHRGVVLVLEHDPDAGALGVVVNRPTDLPLPEALTAWEARVAPPTVVFLGGPVALDTVIALGHPAAPSRCVVGDVGTVDLYEEPSAIDQVRLFAGHAGWAPGQLEDELDDGGWVVLDAEPGDPFFADLDGGNLWREVLRRQGTVEHHALSLAPPDLSWN